MDVGTLENALIDLPKSNEKSKLLKSLVVIRKHLGSPNGKDNITKMLMKDVLNSVIEGLLSPEKKIVDICLSILSLYCMDFNAVQQILVENVLPIFSILYEVLRKYESDDSVNGRIFHIIRNIFQHGKPLINILMATKPQLVHYIIDYVTKIANVELGATHSKATLIMGIQVLRALLIEMLNNQTLIFYVKTLSVLRILGMLLTKLRSDGQQDNSYERILTIVKRLLTDYSRMLKMRNFMPYLSKM